MTRTQKPKRTPTSRKGLGKGPRSFDAEANCYGPADEKRVHDIVDALFALRAYGNPESRHLVPSDEIEHRAILALDLSRYLSEVLAGWAMRYAVGHRLLDGRTPATATEPDKLGAAMLSGDSSDEDPSGVFSIEDRRGAVVDILRLGTPASRADATIDFANALENLNWGSDSALFDKSDVKRKGNVRSLNFYRLMAVQVVAFRRGLGETDDAALKSVADGLAVSPDGIKKWRKDYLPRDLGKSHVASRIAAGQRAGEMVKDGAVGGNVSTVAMTALSTSAPDRAALNFLYLHSPSITGLSWSDGMLSFLKRLKNVAESRENRRTRKDDPPGAK